MIFLTVGSALPFDRLVEMVDHAVAEDVIETEVFGQIGAGSYQPKHFEFVRFLPQSKYELTVATAQALISHAGIGTIVSALKRGLPMLVLPRNPAYGELVDDHQEKTAEAFAREGHLLVFHDTDELATRYRQLAGFEPVPRTPNVAGIATAIGKFMNTALPPKIIEQN